MCGDSHTLYPDSGSPDRIERLAAQFSEAVPTPVLLIRPDGAILHCNRSAATLLNLRSIDMTGRSISDALDLDGSDTEALLALLRDSAEGEREAHPITVTIRRSSDTLFQLEVSMSRVALAEGTDLAIVTLREMASQTVADDLFSKLAGRCSALADIIADGLCVIDPNGYITHVNQQFCSMLSRSETDLFGTALVELLDPDSRKRLESWIASVGDTSAGSLHIDFTRPDNALIHTSASLRRVAQPAANGDVASPIIAVFKDISETREKDAALRHRDQNYRLLVENARAAISLVDREGIFTFVNESAAHCLGTESADVIGKSMWQLFPDEVADRQMIAIRSVIDHAAEHTTESNTFVNGEWRWFHITLQPFRNDSGEVAAALVIAHDVDQLKKAEEELRAERDFVTSLIETSVSMIVCLDGNGNITVFNPRCEEVTGYTRDEVIGRNWPDLMLPESARHNGLRNFSAWVRRHPSDSYEGPIITKSGEIRTILWSNSALFANDQVIAIAVGQDITERKAAEAALRESEEAFRMIAEAIPIPVAVSRLSDGMILYANARLGPTFGYSIDEIMQISSLSLYQNESDRIYIAQRLASGGSVRNYELQGRRKDGSNFWAILNLDMIMFGGEKCVFGGFVDVTERIGVEVAVRDSERRFRELADLLPQIVFETDTSGAFTFVNASSLTATGYSADDLATGLTVFDVIAGPTETLSTASRFSAVMQGGTTNGTEYLIRRKDNSTFPAMVYSSPIVKNGTAVGVRGIAIDITERKKAETELKEAYRKLSEEEQQLVQKNIALGEVLKHIEAEREQIRVQVRTNMNKLVTPLLQLLADRTGETNRVYIQMLTSALDDLTSPFLRKLETQFSRLTPREIQVCDMIRGGKTSKEIASTLGISALTVHKFRQIIRRKLGITNKHNNLETFLKSM